MSAPSATSAIMASNPRQSAAQPIRSPAYPLIRSARLEDIDAILVLHQEAFADKFGGAFGANDIARGCAALATAWRRQGEPALRGMLVAEWEQEIIGTTTLRTREMAYDDGGMTEQAFQQVLGLWSATRSIFALSLLSHRIRRDEGFITDVAVQSAWRRRGIARLLLVHAESAARLRQKRYLGLYVAASNPGAIALYESSGFARAWIRRSWLARLFFGQREWLYMRKGLV